VTLVTDVTGENTPIICIISRSPIERVLLLRTQYTCLLVGIDFCGNQDFQSNESLHFRQLRKLYALVIVGLNVPPVSKYMMAIRQSRLMMSFSYYFDFRFKAARHV